MENTNVPSKWSGGIQGIIETKRSRDKSRGVVGCRVVIRDVHKMEQYDEFYEKEEEEVNEIGKEEIAVDEVTPQPLKIQLELQGGLQLVRRSRRLRRHLLRRRAFPLLLRGRLWGTYSHLGVSTHWTISPAWSSRPLRRGQLELKVAEPEILRNFRYSYVYFGCGVQWELKLLRCSGEIIFCRLRAYLAGYNSFTNFNRRQWLRLFHAWMVAERQEQLESLTAVDGFSEF